MDTKEKKANVMDSGNVSDAESELSAVDRRESAKKSLTAKESGAKETGSNGDSFLRRRSIVAKEKNEHSPEKRKKCCQKSSNKTDKSEQKPDHMKYGAKHVIQLFIPVSICMIFVVTAMNVVYANLPDTTGGLAITPFHSKSAADTKNEGLNAFYNSLIIIGFVALMTVVLVILYFCKCHKALLVWFIVATLCIMTVFVGFFVHDVFRALNCPLDWITFSFLLWNWSILGMMSIFWKAPLLAQQIYLVIDCCIMAIFFIRHLPEWTPWMLLGFIALWDLFAVLAPCGPLRLLVEKAQERDDKLGGGLVYTAGILFGMVHQEPVGKEEAKAEKMKGKKNVTDGKEPSLSSSDDNFEQDNIRLGLGDFIFYSLLVGKASMEFDWSTTIACFIAILVGLAFTLILLSLLGKALPALPISIALGLVFYFATSKVISPFISELSYRQLFL